MKLLFVLSLVISATALQAAIKRTHDLQKSLNADQAKDLGVDVMRLAKDLSHCKQDTLTQFYHTIAIESLTYSDDRLGYSLTAKGHGKMPRPSIREFDSTLIITRTRVTETGPKKSDAGPTYATTCEYEETNTK